MDEIFLENLPSLISKRLEEIRILYAYKEESIEILGSNENEKEKHESYFLKQVTITDLPKENIWVFEAETSKKQKLGLSGKTVERCLLFLQESRFYLLMIELKSKIKDCKKLRESVNEKFEDTLDALLVYLSKNDNFIKIKDLQLIPVGILCFNKDEYSVEQGGSSLICRSFLNFKQSRKSNQSVKLEPVILNVQIIDFLIFQNPIFEADENAIAPAFEISFHELIPK